MTFRHLYSEAPGERLLHVVLEEPSDYGSEYRHIRATVLRRAASHVMREDGSAVAQYWDDHNATGYRVASYVLTKTGGTYVDDMQLRGQIDNTANPMHEGRPYGNQVDFRPYSVDANSARAISDFYTKYGKFLDKNELYNHSDDFYVALHYLAVFLKITKVIFSKPGVRQTNLGDANNFEELNLVEAGVRINEMLRPFAKSA